MNVSSTGSGSSSFDPSAVDPATLEAAKVMADRVKSWGTTEENKEIYTEAMTTIVELYTKTEPYTQDDYEALMKAMKDLEALLEKGPPPTGPTVEMRYNINVILKMLESVGITSDGSAEDPLTAMEDWSNIKDVKVMPWGSKPGDEPVSISDFIMVAPDAVPDTASTGNLIATLVLPEVFDYFNVEMTTLAEQMQATIAIIEQLTILVNLANEVEIEPVGDFSFPMTNSGQIPPPGTDEWNKIEDIMHESGKDEDWISGDDYEEYDGSLTDYEDMTWDEAFTAAYEDDVAAAEALMAENPGMTFDEAMAQQNRAATVLNEFVTSDHVTPEEVGEITDILMDYHFEVTPTTGLSDTELEELWDSVMAVQTELKALLEIIDPIPVPTPADYVPQRDQPNTLAYFLEEIINDIDSIATDPNLTDAQKAEQWLMLCVEDEDGGTSEFMNNINMAISAATSLSTEQNMEMQKLLALFQSWCSMTSTIMDTLNQMMLSMAKFG